MRGSVLKGACRKVVRAYVPEFKEVDDADIDIDTLSGGITNICMSFSISLFSPFSSLPPAVSAFHLSPC